MWHLLVSWHWISDSGRTSDCHPSTYDTTVRSLSRSERARLTSIYQQFPANATDDNITPDRVIESPFPSNTPTIFLSYLSQIASTARTITEELYPVHLPSSPVTWGLLIDLNADLSSVESTFPPCFGLAWHGDLVKPLEESELSKEVIRIRVHLLLLQQYIRLNRPL